MSKENKLYKKLKWKFKLFGWLKIPMIGYVRPKIVEINTEKVKVLIRLNRRTKNHLDSMYFGALSIGADLASAIHVVYFSELDKSKVSFSFKEVHGEFLMRAESDVTFESESGKLIRQMLNESELSGLRMNNPIKVIAKNTLDETVAKFELVLSLRVLK